MSSGSDISFDPDDSVKDTSFNPFVETMDMSVDSFAGPSTSFRCSSENMSCSEPSLGLTPLLFNGKFFSIVKKVSDTAFQKSAGGIIAECRLCNKKTAIKGSLKVTSNFLQHLKLKHNPQYKEYLAEKGKIKKNKGRKSEQSIFDEKLLKFVVETFSPLSIVDHPAFTDLFKETGLKVSTRRTITTLLAKNYSFLVFNIKEKLKTISYVCTTADVWSGRRRSFFGYTCHWIDEDFTRKSAALACRRFAGTHSFNRIADVIQALNIEFGLNENKIVCTITDNGSNFVKAFKEFGIKRSYVYNEEEQSSDSEEEIETAIPSFRLPKHVRCGCHTLNLLATTDFLNLIKKDGTIYEKHKTCLSRCTNIWNKCNRPKTAEIIKNLLLCSLKTPVVTRWNSLYDSIKQLLEHKEKFSELCILLNIDSISYDEIAYLEEYCLLMKPISEGIDFLQKEDNNYFGYFLPALISVKVKLNRLGNSHELEYLKYVANELQTALINRFNTYFRADSEAQDAILASLTCPTIKEKFVIPLSQTAPHISTEFVRSVFIKYVDANFPDNHSEATPQTLTQNSLSFLDFGDNFEETQQENNKQLALKRELKLFLNDDDESLTSLRCYPTVKKVFIKTNTPLPSSAPVERLFSFAGIVNTQRRQNLSDDNFEKLVISKANKII